MSSQTQTISSNMGTEISGPVVFSGSYEVADHNRYIVDILAYIDEIKAALEKFKAHKLNAPDVDASTFPLPNLGPLLEGVAHDIHDGTGFSLVRGFNTQDYSEEDNLIIFLGLGSYVGSQRGKQRAASWICH